MPNTVRVTFKNEEFLDYSNAAVFLFGDGEYAADLTPVLQPPDAQRTIFLNRTSVQSIVVVVDA